MTKDEALAQQMDFLRSRQLCIACHVLLAPCARITILEWVRSLSNTLFDSLKYYHVFLFSWMTLSQFINLSNCITAMVNASTISRLFLNH